MEPHTHAFQIHSLGQFEMPRHHGPPSEADGTWYRIVRLATSQGGGAQAQEYIQQCAQCEANGEAAILPTHEELELMLDDMNDTVRTLVHASLEIFEGYRVFEEQEASILVRFGNEVYQLADDEEELEEESGVQFSPSQVDDFIQTLPRVDISTLERDEAECSICKLEYGTHRGNTGTMAALDQGLSGEEEAERPVKLSCGHIFGEWCIKMWLVEQPASCPTCRFQFSPIVQKDG